MIQARLTIARRKKVPLSELIDAMTQLSLKHEDELLQLERTPPHEKEPAVIISTGNVVRTGSSRGKEYVYTEE